MFLCLMIELAGLLALESIVLLLGSIVDQVGNDERGRHREDGGPEQKEDLSDPKDSVAIRIRIH
jgi:hypothetical protein